MNPVPCHAIQWEFNLFLRCVSHFKTKVFYLVQSKKRNGHHILVMAIETYASLFPRYAVNALITSILKLVHSRDAVAFAIAHSSGGMLRRR